MKIPDWWAMTILALAAFRIYRLLAKDIILDGPRSWLIRLPREWAEGDDIPEGFKEKWSTFIVCPWCLGFWVCGATLTAYCIVVEWIGVFSFLVTWLAMSAFVGLVAKLDTGEADE